MSCSIIASWKQDSFFLVSIVFIPEYQYLIKCILSIVFFLLFSTFFCLLHIKQKLMCLVVLAPYFMSTSVDMKCKEQSCSTISALFKVKTTSKAQIAKYFHNIIITREDSNRFISRADKTVVL